MFRKFLKSVVGKIVTGYVMIIAVACLTTCGSLYVVFKNNKSDKITTEVLFPAIVKLKTADKLSSDADILINRWVNQPNKIDKDALNRLITVQYPQFKQEYSELVSQTADDSSAVLSKDMFKSFEKLFVSHEKIMGTLATVDDYASDSIIDIADKILKGEVKTEANTLNSKIALLTNVQNHNIEAARAEKVRDSNIMIGMYGVSIVLFLIIGVFATAFSRKTIVKPILQLSELISSVSKGNLVDMNVQKSEDEVGGMVESIEVMIDGMKEKAVFAEKIGQGKYDAEFTLLSNEDNMGLSLVKMRDNLKKSAEDDYKRSWAAEGLAKFANILRNSNNGDSSALYDETISSLVKYLGANQGGLFILNDDRAEDPYLELVACYAYERKKFMEKRIEIGEGILGQAFLEEESVYVTAIPQNYVHITSGLGEATPSCLLCVPLKVNEKIYGILEIASLNDFEDYQIDFVNKLGENIASTISNSKINDKTYKLLEISKTQTEEMKSQEEEMRQNMEELQATQEEMERKEREYKNLIDKLQDELAKYKA